MHLYKINKLNYKKFFKNFIKTDEVGANILAKKISYHTLLIKDLHAGAANILKQDALSIGADLAVPRGTILNQDKKVNAVLIGTTKHFEILSRKELTQPFGLKELAKKLKSFTKVKKDKVQIMGVINANDDSFFKNSRFKGKDAIAKIKTMIDDGATIIDIGGVSSRPGSKVITSKEELNRIKPICDAISKNKLYEKVTFSIDSYTPKVIEYALKSGFTIVNDITGLSNDKVIKVVAKYKATVVIMHMKGTPDTMQVNPTYDDVMIEVDEFFTKRILKAKKFGIKNIILDVGIGFGKTLEHNLTLLNNLSHFNHFGYPILLGASRKSMIDTIISTKTEDRLAGTLAIHLESIKQGATIIRCHDVKEHHQAIKVQEAILNK